jgi:hypothetical protein
MAGAAAFLGAVAAYVWISGLHLRHAHAAAVSACRTHAATCGDLVTKFNFTNHALQGGYLLQIVPALIGAFVGATVLARELESGTFRYAWTQGFGRSRWTLAKLAALGVTVAAAASAVGVLFSWYYEPYFAANNQALSLSDASPYSLGLFDLHWVAFAGWTLVAFAIGGLAGLLIRRVVPAIVATLTAYTALAVVAANGLRQHYLTPVVKSSATVPNSAWIMGHWWTTGGRFAFAGWRGAPPALMQRCASLPAGPLHKPSRGTLAQCFAQHGYTQWTRYQPAGRFWTFQVIEGAWLLALSVLLIAATVAVVNRRAA